MAFQSVKISDIAVRMLVFECVTFNCLKGVTVVVDCVNCVPIPIKKQDDAPLWVAETWRTPYQGLEN